MKNKFKLYIITLCFGIAFAGYSFVPAQTEPVIPLATQQTAQCQYVNALDIVAVPNRFLNKCVTVKAKFDKFSTLGLDYSPALRKSDNYISFLIQRDDVKDHNIPLSEMKIFMKRTEAEKYIDLNAGDEIEFSGKVFSNALGDAWIDASRFTVISKKEQPKK